MRIFDPKQREQISGVVGSYQITQQAFRFDIRRALALLAVISLSLAIINLFPFLPLDGGHVFWSLVEKVRGRPVPFRVMEQAGVLGFFVGTSAIAHWSDWLLFTNRTDFGVTDPQFHTDVGFLVFQRRLVSGIMAGGVKG